MIWLLAHPLPLISRQQVVSLSPGVSSVELTDGRRGREWEMSQSDDGETAWSSINHSILYGYWHLIKDIGTVQYRDSNNNFSYICHCDSRREGKDYDLVNFTALIRIRVPIFQPINSLIFTVLLWK
jgi:hypothetical protein